MLEFIPAELAVSNTFFNTVRSLELQLSAPFRANIYLNLIL